MATVTASGVQEGRAATSRRALVGAIFAAFLIRMVVVCCVYRYLPDADKLYERFGWETGWIARALASGHGFSSPFYVRSGPTAMVSPLYTALLAGVFRLFGIYTLTSAFVILSINSLFSSLTCIPVYYSAKYSLGLRGAKLASWAWAVYPLAIYFSAGRVWEYSLTSLLFTACFCISLRIQTSSKWIAWLGFGLLWGITANSNPAVLSTLPFLLILALWKVNKAGGRWLLYGSLTSIGVIAALMPWTIRNYRVLHVLCPVRDNLWSNIYVGNIEDNLANRYPFLRTDDPSTNSAQLRKFLEEGEVAYFGDRKAQAIEFIRHNPQSVGIASLRRVVMYWTGYWSFSRSYLEEEPTELPLMFMLICVTGFMARGVSRFWRENRSEGFPYFILIAIFPLTYYLTLALMDYRQPIEPEVMILVIAGMFPFRSTKPGEWLGAERARSGNKGYNDPVQLITRNHLRENRQEFLPARQEHFLEDLFWQDEESGNQRCPLCAGKFHVRLRQVERSVNRGSFDVLRCDRCGLGKTHPVPSDLAPYYENYHGGRHGVTDQRCVKRRISILSSAMRERQPGMLLDIGCGDGSFLLAARKSGWSVQGTEFNPLAARQSGIDVVTDLGEIPDTPHFDCITLWHSLEHLHDPLATLRSIRSRLHPSGVLLISVPDIEGIQAKLFGRRWFHLDVPRHLYHFSRTSLSALLRATGFSPVQRWHQEFEYDLIGWPQSALNCFLATPDVFFNLLMGRSPRCSAVEKVTSYIGGALLTGLAVPLVAMGSLMNRGATLIVAAHPCETQ